MHQQPQPMGVPSGTDAQRCYQVVTLSARQHVSLAILSPVSRDGDPPFRLADSLGCYSHAQLLNRRPILGPLQTGSWITLTRHLWETPGQAVDIFLSVQGKASVLKHLYFLTRVG
jgi:hypothetical protein